MGEETISKDTNNFANDIRLDHAIPFHIPTSHIQYYSTTNADMYMPYQNLTLPYDSHFWKTNQLMENYSCVSTENSE